MSLSRRSFVQTLGAGATGMWIASRGREASLFEPLHAQGIQPTPGPAPSIILSSNENPLGCHRDVLAGVRAAFGEAGRYPFATADEVADLIARKHGVRKENVLLGSGSTQILRTCTHVFTTKTAGLVAAIPAYEECADYARLMGHPLTGVKLTADLKMDLSALQAASKGAGLVFYCNPNNPVATAISGADTRAYLATLMKDSPNTTVLVDEAYFEYATMPGYETMIPLAVENPRVVVARTFSKCFGMAGLRVGYGVASPEVADLMNRIRQPFNVNNLALAAAVAALDDHAFLAESFELNRRGMEQIVAGLKRLGLEHIPSHGNFVTFAVADGAAVNQKLLKQGVIVRPIGGYGLPNHLRVTIGLPEENERFLAALEKTL